MKTCVATEKQEGCAVAVAFQAATQGAVRNLPADAASARPILKPVRRAQRTSTTVSGGSTSTAQAVQMSSFGSFSQPKQSVSQLVQTREGLAAVLKARLPEGTEIRAPKRKQDGALATLQFVSPQGAVQNINYADLMNYVTFEEYVKGLPNIHRDPGADSAFFKTSLHQEYGLAYQVSRHSSLRRMQQLVLGYLRNAFGANFNVTVAADDGKLVLTTDIIDPAHPGTKVKLNDDIFGRILGAVSEMSEEDLAALLPANNNQLLRAFPAVTTSTGATTVKPLTARELSELDIIGEATDLTDTMKDNQVDDILKRAENFNRSKSLQKAYEDVNAYFDLLANVGRVQQMLGLPVELVPKTTRSAFTSRASQYVFKPYQMSIQPLEETAREAAVRVYACLHRADFSTRVNQAKQAASRLITGSAFARYISLLKSHSIPELNAMIPANGAAVVQGNHNVAHDMTHAEQTTLHGLLRAAYENFSKDELTVRIANAEEA